MIKGVEPVIVLGLQDHNLNEIENAYPDTKLTARGSVLKITGSSEDVDAIKGIINDLIDLADRQGSISEDDLQTILTLKKSDPEANVPKFLESDIILKTFTGETVRAKTPGQRKIVEATAQNDITFAIGPAGTGKTYTSVALAVRALKERAVKKIVLCRPAVEAGESLGFLPGGLREKIDPYLRPLYDSLEEMIDYETLELNMAKNTIEIAPLAYMRGRTLNNAFVILDEAQNATKMQMKMFLTRLGINSRAIITGDITQTDLPSRQKSGLISVQNILDGIKGIQFVYLDQQDVVRHRIIREIISAYEKYEEKQ
ncbi:MAG TPA: PhoH family protein [Balneolales bacterium]|nr:PhoH family protein [Balneolales bacterium]